MAGVKSVKCDRITNDEIVAFIRRWSRSSKVTTRRIAEHFWLGGHGLLGRLKKIDCLKWENVPGHGNVWSVKE